MVEIEAVGLSFGEIDAHVQPLAGIIMFKGLDEEGDVAYYARSTDGLSTVEAVGMVEYLKAMMVSGWNFE